jgi:hypothetical protein
MSYLYLIIFIIIFVSIAITVYSFAVGAPIFFTPKRAIRNALKYCNSKPNSKFYDLGAGNGRAMIIAGKEFGLKPYGFELSPIFYLVTKINIYFFGNKNSRIFCQNFYNRSLKDADIVFCFLKPSVMEKLKIKFKKELKPGTKIISYSFSIPDWKPEKTIRNGYPGNIYIYTL